MITEEALLFSPSELQLIGFGALSFYSEIMKACLEITLGEISPFFLSEVSGLLVAGQVLKI